MRVAVVGHVEWCEFAEVPHVPRPGEIVHAAETFEEPAGGGAVAAVQLRKLAGEATLFTAFGDDETGHRTDAKLRQHGVHVEGRFHPEPQRRAFVHLDSDGERTITVLGPRLGPSADDGLPWDLLDHTDAVYDQGVIDRLVALHGDFSPLLARIVGQAPRLDPYLGRFDNAVRQLRAGDHSFVARPIADSYHTVWFELHEELIGLLGRTRADEAAAGRAL